MGMLKVIICVPLSAILSLCHSPALVSYSSHPSLPPSLPPSLLQVLRLLIELYLVGVHQDLPLLLRLAKTILPPLPSSSSSSSSSSDDTDNNATGGGKGLSFSKGGGGEGGKKEGNSSSRADGPLFVTLVKYGGEALLGVVPRKTKVRKEGGREGRREGKERRADWSRLRVFHHLPSLPPFLPPSLPQALYTTAKSVATPVPSPFLADLVPPQTQEELRTLALGTFASLSTQLVAAHKVGRGRREGGREGEFVPPQTQEELRTLASGTFASLSTQRVGCA